MKRTVRTRIALASCIAGLVLTGVACAGLFALNIALPYLDLGDLNQKSLESIRCTESPAMMTVGERLSCDITAVENDPKIEQPDYVLVRGTQYLLYASAAFPGFWLNHSDPAFLDRFRQPASVELPDQYTWRLYSGRRTINGHSVYFLVGYVEDGPSLPAPVHPTPDLDKSLTKAIDELATRVGLVGGSPRVLKIPARIINRLDAPRGRLWMVIPSKSSRRPRTIAGLVLTGVACAGLFALNIP